MVPIANPANRFPLPNVSIDLSDQVALVTGATAGLGTRFPSSTVLNTLFACLYTAVDR